MTQPTDLTLLYSPCAIGHRTAPNRWVSQPMEVNDGVRGLGAPSARTVERYARLAAGGWGLVFVEATAVSPDAVGRLSGLVLNEGTAAEMQSLVAAFRDRNPEALLLIQITHSGRQTHPSLGPVAVCPGSEPDLRYLSSAEIASIKQQFVQSALLAEQVGFDGIDYKLCNGYLGNELLRPANSRPDRWGGAFENRARFATEGLVEIAARRRSPTFLLGARISFYEGRPGGFGTAGPATTAYDGAEPLELVRRLSAAGADYVNITGPNHAPPGAPAEGAAERAVATLCYERLTRALVRGEGLPTTVLGGGYSSLGPEGLSVATDRLAGGLTDWLGFGRQSLADPLTPRKVQAGESVDWCSACGACMRSILADRPGGCAVYGRQR